VTGVEQPQAALTGLAKPVLQDWLDGPLRFCQAGLSQVEVDVAQGDDARFEVVCVRGNLGAQGAGSWPRESDRTGTT
jgi:hypothetical protein